MKFESSDAMIWNHTNKFNTIANAKIKKYFTWLAELEQHTKELSLHHPRHCSMDEKNQ